MDRQLTIEPHGENFHLLFHNYMGPWEGHQIEKALDLEEVEPPEGGEDFASVLGPNQAYLWHEMSPDPDLHALITADRLPRLAALVRDREVQVLEGAELLPEPPPREETPAPEPEGQSYIEYIDRRHQSVWHRGWKAVMSAALIRVVPAVLVALLLVVASRHIGDSYSEASLAEIWSRAERPIPEQSQLDYLISPDRSHLMRHRMTVIRFAEGDRMIVGGGHLVRWEGLDDVDPLVRTAASRRLPLVVEAQVGNGRVRVDRLQCGNDTMARNVQLIREDKFAPSDQAPSRKSSAGGESFQRLADIPWSTAESDQAEALEGRFVSVKGGVVREDDTLVLRDLEGVGIELDLRGGSQQLRHFIETMAPLASEMTVDVELVDVYPWLDPGDADHSRKTRKVIGRGAVCSASAESYHIVDRRPAG